MTQGIDSALTGDPYGRRRCFVAIILVAIASSCFAAYSLNEFVNAKGPPRLAKSKTPDKDADKEAPEELPEVKASRTHCQKIYICWALGPPIWFFAEYNWIIWKAGKTHREKYEKLQEHARAIWAALLVVLGILYASKFGLNLS